VQVVEDLPQRDVDVRRNGLVDISMLQLECHAHEVNMLHCCTNRRNLSLVANDAFMYGTMAYMLRTLSDIDSIAPHAEFRADTFLRFSR
jgi:hypothetical protein